MSILRDWAAGIVFEPAAVERVRPVLLAEMRANSEPVNTAYRPGVTSREAQQERNGAENHPESANRLQSIQRPFLNEEQRCRNAEEESCQTNECRRGLFEGCHVRHAEAKHEALREDQLQRARHTQRGAAEAALGDVVPARTDDVRR